MFNVSYSSCLGYSLINTLKSKKRSPYQENVRGLAMRDSGGSRRDARTPGFRVLARLTQKVAAPAGQHAAGLQASAPGSRMAA